MITRTKLSQWKTSKTRRVEICSYCVEVEVWCKHLDQHQSLSKAHDFHPIRLLHLFQISHTNLLQRQNNQTYDLFFDPSCNKTSCFFSSKKVGLFYYDKSMTWTFSIFIGRHMWWDPVLQRTKCEKEMLVLFYWRDVTQLAHLSPEIHLT